MDEITEGTIEQLLRQYREKGLSRGRFMALLAGLGASASGIATLLSSAEASAAGLPPRFRPAHHAADHHHKQLHHEHVQRQSAATLPAADGERAARLEAMLKDYADNAVVEDPLFAEPIVGKSAIAQRKLAEMKSMAGVNIEVTNRYVHGDQVVAEWMLRGTHQGDIFGFKPSGRAIQLRGVTVVTRNASGKISRESLHYDLAELHRQLG